MLELEPVSIFVRFTRHGVHCWPGAPERRAYLRNPHRHLFHVEVQMEVTHDDREVEFHDVQQFAMANFPGGDMGSQSCEMMARALCGVVSARFARVVRVTVAEDGEVGAVVTGRAPSP